MIESKKGKVYFLTGVAGSGKSTLVPALLAYVRNKGVYLAPLDPDAFFGPMERAFLESMGASPDDRDSALFKKIVRPKRYEGLWQGAKCMIDAGVDVLMVAPFTAEVASGELHQHAYEHFGNIEVQSVWLWASEATRKQRIMARRRIEDNVKLTDWDKYESTLPKPSDIKIPVLVNEDLTECIQNISKLWGFER